MTAIVGLGPLSIVLGPIAIALGLAAPRTSAGRRHGLAIAGIGVGAAGLVLQLVLFGGIFLLR